MQNQTQIDHNPIVTYTSYGYDIPQPIHVNRHLLTDDDLNRIVSVIQGYSPDTGRRFRPSLGRASTFLQERFLGVWEDWDAFSGAQALNLLEFYKVSEEVASYFDYERYSDDIEDDYLIVELSDKTIAVFEYP